MKKKMLFIASIFALFCFNFITCNAMSSTQNAFKNCETIVLSSGWYSDGFYVDSQKKLSIHTKSALCYCIKSNSGEVIGYFFENSYISDDFMKVKHFGIKKIVDNIFILELQIENILSNNLLNYDSSLFTFNEEIKNTINILDTSEKGYEFLANSYCFNKNVNNYSKFEVIPYSVFTNIDYGNIDTYIDGYSYVTSNNYIENDGILNIVPENYFFTTGENSFQGKEYGVYKDTFYETHPYYNIGRYVTSVFVYDIEVAYAGFHGDEVNNHLNDVKYSIKPLFSGIYYGYSKTNVTAWNNLGLNPNKTKMVVTCNAYQQNYYLNVNNLNIMNDSKDDAYRFTDISFEFKSNASISSISEEVILFLSKSIQSILEYLPGSNVASKLLNFATTLYENSQPTSLEKYITLQNDLNKYNYSYELDDYGYPAFVSIPFKYNFNNEFIKYNIHTSKYSYNYNFRQNNRLKNPGENRFDFYNLYISSAISIYSKNQNSMSYVSTIISSNDYGVQGINLPSEPYETIVNTLEKIVAINEISTFQSMIFKVNQTGYYLIEVLSPSYNSAKVKATLYNSDGNVVANTDEKVSGTNKVAVHLNANKSNKLTGKYYLRIAFDEPLSGNVKIKISIMNVNNSSSLEKNCTFTATDKIQFIIFKPSITKEYTIYTISDLDPSVTMYRSMVSRYYYNYSSFAYDNSLLNVPQFHQDDGYDYDPEEMYPNLNCYFKMTLYKDEMYVFKIKNNDVINYGQLNFLIN